MGKKPAGARSNRKGYMKFGDEDALKKTREWATEWMQSRPKDVRSWVLEKSEEFRNPVENGLDVAGLHDYIQVKLEVDRSATFCKGLLKELKQKLTAKAPKSNTEQGK